MINIQILLAALLSTQAMAQNSVPCFKFKLDSKQMSKGLNARSQWAEIILKETKRDNLADGSRVYEIVAIDSQGKALENFYVCKGNYSTPSLECEGDALGGIVRLSKAEGKDQYLLSFDSFILAGYEEDSYYSVERKDSKSTKTTGTKSTCESNDVY